MPDTIKQTPALALPNHFDITSTNTPRPAASAARITNLSAQTGMLQVRKPHEKSPAEQGNMIRAFLLSPPQLDWKSLNSCQCDESITVVDCGNQPGYLWH
jgi:hypothetical protein